MAYSGYDSSHNYNLRSKGKDNGNTDESDHEISFKDAQTFENQEATIDQAGLLEIKINNNAILISSQDDTEAEDKDSLSSHLPCAQQVRDELSQDSSPRIYPNLQDINSSLESIIEEATFQGETEIHSKTKVHPSAPNLAEKEWVATAWHYNMRISNLENENRQKDTDHKLEIQKIQDSHDQMISSKDEMIHDLQIQLNDLQKRSED